MLRGAVTALRTLTMLPIPGREAEHPAHALTWFPLVGGLLGGILYAAALIPRWLPLDWTQGLAVFLVFLEVLLTRGLHLDGLADCADGLGGGWTPQRRLEIMKDPRVGAFGVAAIVFDLLVRWVVLVRLIDAGALIWIPVTAVISRTMMVDQAVALPYARPEGGTAGLLVTGAKPWQRLWALTLMLGGVYGLVGVQGLLIALGAWIVTQLLSALYRRRVNGVTGDLLGATNECIQLFCLLTPAISLQSRTAAI